MSTVPGFDAVYSGTHVLTFQKAFAIIVIFHDDSSKTSVNTALRSEDSCLHSHFRQTPRSYLKFLTQRLYETTLKVSCLM